MTDVVLDASAVAAWYLPGQGTTSADHLSINASLHRFFAPHIFPIEVRNLFVQAERRRRIDRVGTAFGLDSLRNLQVRLSAVGDAETWDDALDLARDEKLTTYDALYLQLALGRGFTLASRDAALLEAAGRRAVAVMDLRI